MATATAASRFSRVESARESAIRTASEIRCSTPACVRAPSGGATPAQFDALTRYGEASGLAFQIADDILNVEGDRTLMGKGTGSDAARGKVTFPALMGIDASRAEAEALITGAVASLAPFDERADPLRRIARYILERNS